MKTLKSRLLGTYRDLVYPLIPSPSCSGELNYEFNPSKFLYGFEIFKLQCQIKSLFGSAVRSIYICNGSNNHILHGVLFCNDFARLLRKKDKEGILVRAIVPKDITDKMDESGVLDFASANTDIGSYVVVDSNSVVKFRGRDAAVLKRNTESLGKHLAMEFTSHYVVAQAHRQL